VLTAIGTEDFVDVDPGILDDVPWRTLGKRLDKLVGGQILNDLDLGPGSYDQHPIQPSRLQAI
jgi:hypothetical protein